MTGTVEKTTGKAPIGVRIHTHTWTRTQANRREKPMGHWRSAIPGPGDLSVAQHDEINGVLGVVRDMEEVVMSFYFQPHAAQRATRVYEGYDDYVPFMENAEALAGFMNGHSIANHVISTTKSELLHKNWRVSRQDAFEIIQRMKQNAERILHAQVRKRQARSLKKGPV